MVDAAIKANPVGVDATYGHTDAKEHQNTMAVSGNGTVHTQVYEAVIDPASLADGAGATIQITGCTGVVLGKSGVRTIVNGADLVDMVVTGYVQADTVIELRVQNESGSGANVGSTTWFIVVDTITP